MEKSWRICHITTAHLPEDIRIYQKECVSLADAGYDVRLIQPGDTYVKDDVSIIGLGDVPGNRIKRILFTVRRAYKIAKDLDVDLFQIHDPELLMIGKKLKKRGRHVVFDSHEDYPSQIAYKEWVPKSLRGIFSKLYEKYEKRVLTSIDGVIGVTPHQIARLRSINMNTVMVCNFPVIQVNERVPSFREKRIVFPGMVYEGWCIKAILEAIDELDDIVFSIRSTFDIPTQYMDELKSYSSWKKVDYLPRQNHDDILELLSKSMCGLAISQYGPNVNGKKGTMGNTKIFEYMLAGIPVICSDLELWKDIVETNNCGISVKPNDVEGIRQAIQYVISDPIRAKLMGENGRQAIIKKYNWTKEFSKMDTLYKKILCDSL